MTHDVTVRCSNCSAATFKAEEKIRNGLVAAFEGVPDRPQRPNINTKTKKFIYTPFITLERKISV